MRGKLLNAEDRILAHLRANPSSSREAATALDISPKSVRRVARKHNIKLFAGGNVRYSTQVKSDCLQALKDGISKESISERYGVTISSLKSWAYMAKITLKYKARNNQYTVERSQPKQVETEAPEFVAMRKEYSRAMASQRWFGGLGA
jgi:transposase